MEVSVSQEAVNIVRKALAENNLDLLLFGKQGYSYLPKWSSAPGNTDLTTLLSVIYDTPLGYAKEDIVAKMIYAVNQIVFSYEGLFPVATVILIETLRVNNGRPILGLPLNEIATILRESILKYRYNLITDKTGPGNQWEDGMYGEMRRISDNIVELGGPKLVED
jgi:hypothetical protein